MSRLKELVHKVLRWVFRTDLVVLLAVLAVVAGLWAFVEIADEVTEGDTHELDQQILLSLRDPADTGKLIGPDWLKQSAVDITALGGFTVVTLVVLGVIGFLLLARKYHALVLVLVATAGGGMLSMLLKDYFDRPRPPAELHLTIVESTSFPSGHSMLAAVVYLTLGSLLARLVDKKRLKLYFIGVALLFTFLVGATRVYLGVHYPSDVLAGWSAGLVWAVSCWLVARYLQKRGAVEQNLTPGEDNHDQSAGGDSDGGWQGTGPGHSPAAGAGGHGGRDLRA